MIIEASIQLLQIIIMYIDIKTFIFYLFAFSKVDTNNTLERVLQ